MWRHMEGPQGIDMGLGGFFDLSVSTIRALHPFQETEINN